MIKFDEIKFWKYAYSNFKDNRIPCIGGIMEKLIYL